MRYVIWVTGATAATAAIALATRQDPVFMTVLMVATAAAAADLWDRRIPNVFSLLAAITATLWWNAQGAPLSALVVAAVVGALLFAGWQRDLIGGGDVKLIPSLALAAASASGTFAGGLAHAAMLCMGLVALAWLAAPGARQAPLAAGAPLALAAAVVL